MYQVDLILSNEWNLIEGFERFCSNFTCPMSCFSLGFTDCPFSSNNAARSSIAPDMRVASMQESRAFRNYN